MITTTVTQPEGVPTPPKYPYIGQWEGSSLVVLFIRERAGVVLIQGPVKCDDPAGHFSDSWKETGFTQYQGSITLTNS
jgi:hypothetical protein